MKKTALVLAGLIFAAVSASHFYRYYYEIEIMIGEWEAPLNISLGGGIVAAILALWMFVALRCR